MLSGDRRRCVSAMDVGGQVDSSCGGCPSWVMPGGAPRDGPVVQSTPAARCGSGTQRGGEGGRQRQVATNPVRRAGGTDEGVPRLPHIATFEFAALNGRHTTALAARRYCDAPHSLRPDLGEGAQAPTVDRAGGGTRRLTEVAGASAVPGLGGRPPARCSNAGAVGVRMPPDGARARGRGYESGGAPGCTHRRTARPRLARESDADRA